MKRFASAFLIAMMLISLTACAGNADGKDNAEGFSAVPQQDSESPQTPEPKAEYRFDPETDCDNRFISLETDLIELDNMYVWRGDSNYLIYFDKETGDSGVLCPKPECVHNEVQNNRECLGYSGDRRKSLSYYQGKIYFAGYDHEAGSQYHTAFFRMNRDCSEKEKLFDFDPPQEYNPLEYRVHRGRIYMRCAGNRVVNGETFESLAILSTPLNEWDYRVEYEDTVPDTNPFSNYMRFIGDDVYFAYTYQESEGVYMTKVIRYDRNSLESEELIADRSMTEPMRGFWVDPDGTMIFAPYGYDPDAKIFRAKDGKLEVLGDLHDEDGRFSTVFVGDGAIFGTCGASGPEDMQNKDVWIRDFDGNTIYKGPLTLHFLEGTPYEGNNLFPATMTGDKESLYWHISMKNLNYSSNSSQMHLLQILIKYRITENGLEEEMQIIVDRG